MKKPNFVMHVLPICFPILLIASIQTAQAEIWKWKDERGVTRYSRNAKDAPKGATNKLTPDEIINAMQAKDLCVDLPKKNSFSNASVKPLK